MSSRLRLRTTAALVMTSIAVLATLGCQLESGTRPAASVADSVAYMTVDEFAASLASKDVLVVEFCVPTGCSRCDEMRGPIDRLASDEADRLTVRRVNLRQQPGLAWEFGVTVCPTYVAFRDGEEVFRAAHPTSAGLIAAGLEDSLLANQGEHASLAVQ